MGREKQDRARVWVPCLVKQGAFPHEYSVLIEENTEENWFGFVDRSLLENPPMLENPPVEEGATRVSAIVLERDPVLGVLLCCIPNAGIATNTFHIHESQVELVE